MISYKLYFGVRHKLLWQGFFSEQKDDKTKYKKDKHAFKISSELDLDLMLKCQDHILKWQNTSRQNLFTTQICNKCWKALQ